MTRIYPTPNASALPRRILASVADDGSVEVSDHIAEDVCQRFGFTAVPPAAAPKTVLLVQGVIEATAVVAATVSVAVEDPPPAPAAEEPVVEAPSEGDEVPRHHRSRRR